VIFKVDIVSYSIIQIMSIASFITEIVEKLINSNDIFIARLYIMVIMDFIVTLLIVIIT